METIRMVGDLKLIYEPQMRMFRIVQKKTNELSMWFDAQTAHELKEMDEDEFFETAERYIQDASYAE